MQIGLTFHFQARGHAPLWSSEVRSEDLLSSLSACQAGRGGSEIKKEVSVFCINKEETKGKTFSSTLWPSSLSQISLLKLCAFSV